MPKHKKIIPPSSQELAHINSLKQEVAKLARQANGLYPALSSLVLVYFLIEIMHKYEWSPFAFDRYLDEIYQSPEAFGAILSENQFDPNDITKYLGEVVVPMSQTEEFFKEYGHTNDAEFILENIDNFVLKYPQFNSRMLSLKKKLAEVNYYLSLKFASLMKMDLRDFVKQTGMGFSGSLKTDYPLKVMVKAYYNAISTIEQYIKTPKKEAIKYSVINYSTKVGMQWKKVFWSVIASIVSILVFDYLYHLQGILYPKIIIPKEILTHNAAQKLENTLEQQRIRLLPSAQRNERTARCGIFILPVLCYFFFNQIMLDFPEITTIAINLLVAASVFTLIPDIKNWYHDRNLCRNKSVAKYNLKDVLQQFNAQIELEEKDSLDSSYVNLTFGRYKESPAPAYTALSAKAMAKEFYRCCFFYKLSLIAQEGESMSLPLSAALERKKLQLIRDLFVASISRLAQIKIAERQLYNLSKKYPELNISSFIAYDDSQLSELVVRFSFTDDLPINIREKIFATLDQAGYPLNKTENLSEICLTIHKPFSENILEKLAENLTQTSQDQKAQASSSPKMPASSEIYRPKKQKALKQKPPRFLNLFRRDQNINQDTREISWPSAKYDGKDPNNKVYPLLLGNVHSKAHYQNAHSFIFNALQRKDIRLPGEDGDRLYEAVKSLTERARFVPTFGFQGFVPGQGGVKPDMHGEPFKVKGKGKLLGIFGDARVFLKDELDETGKFTLKVVAAIELKAHKTEHRR